MWKEILEVLEKYPRKERDNPKVCTLLFQMKKLKKHWPAIQLIMINWIVFAFIALFVINWFLRRELSDKQQTIQEMAGEIQTYKHNFEEFNKQYPNSRIYLELKK